MKNLKRVLSLALSTAMVLGMMVVGSAAAGDKEFNNDKAIAAVKVLGVMEGDENGNFNEDKVVTRNEMAVVMANLKDLKLNGTHPFTDVPSWADKYVAAVYTNGISAGTSATTYGGSENVTTTQAALMLMKVLGWFEFQGEFGDDWALATVKRATELDLFKNIDAGVNEGLTRGELAQMVVNTLVNQIVTRYENSGMTVEGNGITVTEKPTYSTSWGRFLCDDLYDLDVNGDGELVGLYSTTYDPYGRPGVKAEYEDETAKAFRTADKVLVNTDDEILTVADLLDDEDIEYDETCDIDIDIAEGYVVELFEDEDDSDILDHVVVYNYAAFEIDEVVECDEDDDEKWIEAGAKYIVKTVDGDELYDIQIAGFDAKTFVDGAWIVVPVLESTGTAPVKADGVEVDDEDEAVYYGFAAAETVSGEVKTLKSSKVRLDNGTQYKALVELTDIAAGDDWTLVLDANGYVVGGKVVDEAATAIDDVYVWVDTYETDVKWGVKSYAVLVDLAGEITEIEINMDDTTAAEKELVVIDENDDDDTILVAWDEEDFDVYENAVSELKKDTKRVDADGTTIRLNAETVYVMVGGEEDDIEATVKTGGVKFASVPGASWIIAEEDEVEALYVVIVDTDEVKEDAKADDVFFVAEVSSEISKDYFVNEVIFEDGSKKDVEFADGQEIEAGAWYEYEIDDDGYYTVTAIEDFLTSVEGATWDEEDGIITGATIVDLYNGLLTTADIADIEVADAKFVDAHDKDEDGQWDKSVNTLAKLWSLIDDEKVENVSIEIVVEEEGATLIILTNVEPA